MIDRVESKVVSPELWPRCGTVSPDRSGVIGYNHEAYIFQGSNNHYDAYFDEVGALGEQWAILTTNRHREHSENGTPVLSLFVPNKATCIPKNFPQPLPKGGTETFKVLKRLLKDDPGVLFSLEDLKLSDVNMLGAWNRTDTHWSKSGCLLAVNEVLKKLDLPLLNLSIEIEEIHLSGDLSKKWLAHTLAELRKDLYCPELLHVTPDLEFDNEKELAGHFGRHVKWSNKYARYDLSVTIVGNSFAGPGNSSRELAWWFARLFSSVTFLHMSQIPKDIKEVTPCDVLIFQTIERFLYIVPNDNLAYSELINHAYRSR
jgi:hypothetical protein